jgi:hypothetical protein
MTFDLNTLSPEDFERLVGGLLVAAGYQITRQGRRGSTDPDYETIAPSGETVIVEVKHYRSAMPLAIIAQFAHDVERYRAQTPSTKGLIVTSGALSNIASDRIRAHAELDVWSGDDIAEKLRSHPQILKAVQSSVGAAQALAALSMVQAGPTGKPPLSAAYAQRLGDIEAGKADWRRFEIWCADILTDIFKPRLGPADRQTRSEDGLDIMDAIFPIRSDTGPWSQVRSEFATRFVVAEFKNYVDPIGQKEVESIAQYLWEKAKRQFGILVSRHEPSEPARKQRRRLWLDQAKMVVFLSASELIAMLEMIEAGEEPFAVIDAQLEAFLRTLTP